MHENPSSLDTRSLAICLKSSAGEERDRQVDFLRYLDSFNAREAWRQAGYGSLWAYCRGELHLREGAAGRRIGAMRVLREFPDLEAPLRDGRLSLTTAVTLRPVLTRENLAEMVARAAFESDEETRHLVASLQPRPAPREGIRRLPDHAPRLPAPAPGPADGPAGASGHTEVPTTEAEAPEPVPFALTSPPSRPSLEPLSTDQWSMRVTIDGALKDDVETLRCLLSHKLPEGDLAAVLREAVRCGIDKHGKRRGLVKPERPRKPAEKKPAKPVSDEARRSGVRGSIPARVKRAVWERDGYRCTYVSPDGRRCQSRWQLELDHAEPVALGGPSTVETIRGRCRVHNLLHAEDVFGCEHMVRFRRKGPEPRTGESTIAGESAQSVKDAVTPPAAGPRHK